MPQQSILCLTLDGDPGGVVDRLRALGWEVSRASDIPAAERLLARRQFAVGLLTIGTTTPAEDDELELCIRASGNAEWVAVCDTQALESSGFRELLLGRFFDHQLPPVDSHDLDLVLKHAAQRATLLGLHRMQLRSGNTMGMVGNGAAITRLRRQIRKVAATDAPVLIGGESGSGKELAAKAIHQGSQRADGPFVAVNCGAISPSLIHAELFGHERGAFTGASSERRGLIEAANGGTVFLDEIGDLPVELQTNLLRFLQEKTITRVGAARSLPVNARVVAASHVDLAEAVAVGKFREDLFYRLNVLPIEVPALRSRMEDVPILAEHFFALCTSQGHTRVKGFSRHAIAAMTAHDWPGNVRELYNRVQRAVVMSDDRMIGPEDLGLEPAQSNVGQALDNARTAAERDAISHTLARVGRNVTRAARELGISRMTLYRLMEKYRIA